MSSDADQPIGYAAAFETYFKLGWKSPLPLPPRAKKSPPAIKCHRAKFADHPVGCKDCVSYTGYGAIEPSYPDLLAWADSFSDGNLCLRLPNNEDIALVGIDVDAYGAKTGAAAFVEAVKRWGPLPQSPRSSSRAGDLTSGIRIFRVPAGTVLETKINFPSLGIGDIEVIQAHHRYVNAWPSIHPEGGHYNWRDEYDNLVHIPAPTDFPELPARWIEGLKVVPRSQIDGPLDFNIRQAMTDGVPSTTVQERLMQAVRELQVPGASRHDTCTKHVMAIARLGKSGEPGVKQALQLLCDVLIAARAVDKSGTEQETRGEFLRMLTNDNIARELSRPGIVNWVAALITDGLATAPDHQPIESSPAPSIERQNDSGPSTAGGAEVERPETVTNADGSGAVLVDDSAPRNALTEIEQGFWDSRESLKMVWQTSMARLTPPWAVLGICAARALAQVRPHTTLPPLIGGPGSLNWFLAIVADSAGGKTTSGSAAELLVPGHLVTCQQGTGEGILATFGKCGDPNDPLSVPEYESVLVDVDEIDSLTAVGGRSGSTTMPILRSAFSGATLGFAYANKDKRRFIRRHSYRMTAVVGIQPERAGDILAQAAGGTPQRFMWFPATDSRVRRKRPWESGPLTLPKPGEWLYPRQLTVPLAAEDLIIDEHVKRQQGGQDALDGHSLFCREKFAYALTVLDGRVQMNEEDWQLSGIAADISMYTRRMVSEQLREASRIEAIDRGETRGIENVAAEESKQYEESERIRHALRWSLAKIANAGPDGISNRELTNSSDSRRTRKWLNQALDLGRTNGLIRVVEGTTNWVMV